MNRLDLEEYNGFIGLPIASTDLIIADDDGYPVPVGQQGEICVKGPQVTKGYWRRPEETARAFTQDGYYRTGDYATINEQGYVKILDRKKDMIIVSGFNVYPNEIEDVVSGHPGVLEVAAVGIEDEKSGERVKIYVCKKQPGLTEEELMTWCRERLTSYKLPKEVEFRNELPKSTVGKILRRALRNEKTAKSGCSACSSISSIATSVAISATTAAAVAVIGIYGFVFSTATDSRRVILNKL